MHNRLLHFPERLGPRARLLVAVSVLWAAPVLACGSFAPRPTPTPTLQAPIVLPDTAATSTPEPLVIVDATPTIATTAPLPTTPLTATQPTTQTAAPPAAAPAGNVLAAGAPARVTAPDGLNLRTAAGASGTLIVQLATGARVTVLEGPVQADNFTWWRIDSGAGQTGWVAEGDGETVWLSPQLGEPQAVDRSPRVSDRVIVSTLLSIRATPGTGATLLVQVQPNTQYTVLAGPQQADGLTWFQLRSDDGTVEGWAAEGDGTTRWISPLE
ncbi:MAG: SH3 domain-containing protein [Caldilineaceae bacterium]